MVEISFYINKNNIYVFLKKKQQKTKPVTYNFKYYWKTVNTKKKSLSWDK